MSDSKKMTPQAITPAEVIDSYLTSTDLHSNSKRREAILSLISLLPASDRKRLTPLLDKWAREQNTPITSADDELPATELELCSEIRRSLNEATVQGSLGRRDFLKIAGLLMTSGLASMIFPQAADAMVPMAFWKKKKASGALAPSGYPMNTGSDPYWDYVVLCMNMDTPTPSTGFTTVFADESNVGKIPTINGTPYIDSNVNSSPYSGRTGGARFTKSATDSLAYAHSGDFDLAAGNFTLEFWVKASNTGGVICKRTNSAFTSFMVSVGGSGPFNLDARFSSDGSTWGVAMTSSPLIASGTWTHCAVVRNGSGFAMYINGSLAGSATSGMTLMSESNDLVIGRDAGNSGSLTLEGSLADLRIYKGIAKYTSNFTPRTTPIGLGTANDPYWGYCVLACPFENSLKDMSGKQTLPAGDVVLTTATKKFGTASAKFDGSGDSLFFSNTEAVGFGTADFTIEFWVYPTATGSSGGGVLRIGQLKLKIRLDGDGKWKFWYSEQVYGELSGSLNQWQHVALVRYSGVYRLFVDGALSYQMAVSMDYGASNDLALGYSLAGSEQFNGYIDSLRITKGYARYTSNFTPPTASFPVGKDESVDPFWNFTVLAMHMDDFSDATGRHTITNNNSVGNNTSTYKYGTASASFDGTTQFLSTSNSSDWALGTSDFTIECWFYRSGSAEQTLVAQNYGTNFGWWFEYYNGSLQWNCSSNGTTWDMFGSMGQNLTSAVTANTWHHAAVTRNGSIFRLFLNGVLITSGTSSSSIVTCSNNLYIGSRNGAVYPLNGYIDDLRITKGVARYTQNFTPPTRAFATTPVSSFSDYDPFFSNVVLLMHMDGANGATTFTDSSSYAHSLMPTGANTSTSVFKFGTSSASFNGSSSISSTAGSPFVLSGDFTIEAFVNFADNATSIRTILCLYYSVDYRFRFGKYGSGTANGAPYVSLIGTGTGSGAAGTSAPTIGVWTHLAVSRSGSHLRLFQDGVLIGSDTSFFKTISESPTLHIGANTNGGPLASHMNGYIDEIRFTNGIARYTADFAPPRMAHPNSAGIVTSGLVALLDAGDVLSTNAPSTTNLFTYSEQFDNAAWGKTSASITSNSTTSPNGSTTADTITDTSNSITGFIYQDVTVSNDSNTYTVSVYVKKNAAQIIAVRAALFGGTGVANAVAVDTSTGAFTTASSAGIAPSSCKVTDAGTFWRVAFSTLNNSSGNTTIRVGIYPAYASSLSGSGLTANTPENITLTGSADFWGAQLEVSPCAGPYIVTTSSSASRTVTHAWNNMIQNPADGSSPAAYDFKYGDGSTSSTYPTFTGIAGGRSANDYFSFDGGDYFTLAGANSTFLNSLHKAGAAYTVCGAFHAPSSYTANGDTIMSTRTNNLDAGFTLQVNSGRTLTVYVSNGSGDSYLVTSTDSLHVGWNYFGFSYSFSGVSFFYINGRTQTVSSTYNSPSSSSGSQMRIGITTDGNTGRAIKANGGLGCLVLYNRGLSQSELDQNFAAIRSRFGI